MRAGQQYGMQPPQQQGKDNIAYNVEHVFKDENGREVGTNHDKVFFISIVFRCERCPWILMAKQYGWSVFPAAAVVNRFVGFGADFQFHLATVLQDGGDGAIVLNMEDHEEIPKAVVKPP